MSEFDLPGPVFLTLYAEVFCAAVFSAFVVRTLFQVSKSNLTGREDIDVYDAAYMRGGERSAVEAAITSLMHRNIISISLAQNAVEVLPSSEDLHPLELRIIQVLGRQPVDVAKRLCKTVIKAEDLFHGKLADMGLIVGSGKTAVCRVITTLILLAPLAFLATPKILVGLSRHKPVTYLALFFIINGLLAMWFFATTVLRTFHGEQVLQRMRSDYSSLGYSISRGAAVSGAEIALALALFGGGALLSSPSYASAASLFRPTHSNYGGASYSGYSCSYCGAGGCGGGGCGGGGCGG